MKLTEITAFGIDEMEGLDYVETRFIKTEIYNEIKEEIDNLNLYVCCDLEDGFIVPAKIEVTHYSDNEVLDITWDDLTVEGNYLECRLSEICKNYGIDLESENWGITKFLFDKDTYVKKEVYVRQSKLHEFLHMCEDFGVQQAFR